MPRPEVPYAATQPCWALASQCWNATTKPTERLRLYSMPGATFRCRRARLGAASIRQRRRSVRAGKLNDWSISVDQFLDLNEKIGCYDRDGNMSSAGWQATRRQPARKAEIQGHRSNPVEAVDGCFNPVDCAATHFGSPDTGNEWRERNLRRGLAHRDLFACPDGPRARTGASIAADKLKCELERW
jgi:hypothetical protein